jgi:hypothetical protein
MQEKVSERFESICEDTNEAIQCTRILEASWCCHYFRGWLPAGPRREEEKGKAWAKVVPIQEISAQSEFQT